MSIDVTSVMNSIGSLPNTRAASSTAPVSEGASERNMFMSLLVAQLKNQDPLAPQDGAAFVAQLAQFNSLDQLVGIRDSIEKLNLLLQQQNQPTAVSTPVKN
ncbi:MAG: flagellar hook capping FlgD N-terminal domain-containing protein [Acidobacteriota bacterium]